MTLNRCKKDSETSYLNETFLDINGDMIECKNGILFFASQDHFFTTANELNLMDIEAQAELNYLNDFKSQEVLFHEINEAEEEFYSVYYKGIDPGISVSELNAMGYEIKHSGLFNMYVEKGFIKVIKEDDGSESYVPDVFNPAIMSVVNEDGFVVVNDTLFQYTPELLKLTPFKSFEQVHYLNNTTASSNKDNIYIISMKNRLKGYIRHIDHSEEQEKGSNLRVKSRYALWDGDNDGQYFSPASGANITHFLELKAEEKRFGTWKIRSSYKPLCGTEGTWQTCIDFISFTDCTWYQSGPGVYYSPLDKMPFSSCTNYYKVSLSPVGWISQSGYQYNGIVSGNWSFVVDAASIDDPDNSGSY